MDIHALTCYGFSIQGRYSNPGRTARADIRLNIRKITGARVELSVQPWITVLNRSPQSLAPLSAWILMDIGVTNIRA